jgi:alkylation response protein AidB-like acyl-CoA dehydrogenase
MIERSIFTPDHEAFRDSFRRFIAKEIAPFHEAWEEQGYVSRDVWRTAGENGFLCMTMPEEYGGGGADQLYSVIQMEELSTAKLWPLTFCVTALKRKRKNTFRSLPAAQ